MSIYSKNENYLARFIPLFEKQVGMDLNAEQMLTEIIRDNAYVMICILCLYLCNYNLTINTAHVKIIFSYITEY